MRSTAHNFQWIGKPVDLAEGFRRLGVHFERLPYGDYQAHPDDLAGLMQMLIGVEPYPGKVAIPERLNARYPAHENIRQSFWFHVIHHTPRITDIARLEHNGTMAGMWQVNSVYTHTFGHHPLLLGHGLLSIEQPKNQWLNHVLRDVPHPAFLPATGIKFDCDQSLDSDEAKVASNLEVVSH